MYAWKSPARPWGAPVLYESPVLHSLLWLLSGSFTLLVPRVRNQLDCTALALVVGVAVVAVAVVVGGGVVLLLLLLLLLVLLMRVLLMRVLLLLLLPRLRLLLLLLLACKNTESGCRPFD